MPIEGLLAGLGSALKEGTRSYQAETERQDRLQAQALARKLQEKNYQLNLAKSGLVESEDGAFTESPLAIQKRASDQRMKLAEKGLIGNINDQGFLTGTPRPQVNVSQDKSVDREIKQLRLQKARDDAKSYQGAKAAAATFARRIEQAEEVFKNLEQSGFDRTSKISGIQSLLPGMIQSGNIKAQEQAERNFVNAVLRRESGANISESEFENANLQYFPRVGDTPEVLAQKAKNRQAVLAGLKAEAGKAYGLLREQERMIQGGDQENIITTPDGKRWRKLPDGTMQEI